MADYDGILGALAAAAASASGRSTEFGMVACSKEEELDFQPIEDLAPGDWVRKLHEDGKRWPVVGETARVYKVYTPTVMLDELEHGKREVYDFSILTKPRDEEGKQYVEFVFDSRNFRKIVSEEDDELD